MKRLIFKVLIVLLSIGIFGCAKKPVERCVSPEDNPEHHYLRGMEAIENGRIDVAMEKFERALYCDEKFSMAHNGMAISLAMKAERQTDPKFREVEVQRVNEHLSKAKKLLKKPEDEFDHYLARMRVEMSLKGKDYLSRVEDNYEDAIKLKVDERKLVYYQGTEALHYFMAEAYLSQLEFEKARDRYRDVLNAKRESKWHEKAERGWKKTDRIVRAIL